MKELAGSFTNSAARATVVVEFLASHPGETFSLSEITRRCGLRKSTAHTVLGVLHDAGWLTRSPADLGYGLGPTLISVGRAAEKTRPDVNLARPVLQRLAIELQRECVLSTASDDEILILESTGSPGLRRRSLQPGQRFPMVVPFGTVFAAWQDAVARNEWYRRSGFVEGEPREELDRLLAVIVARGYAVTLASDPRNRIATAIEALSEDLTLKDVRRALLDELSQLAPLAYLIGDVAEGRRYAVDTVQAPVFDADGGPRYALTVNEIDRELDAGSVGRLGVRVREVADEISATLLASQRSAQ